MIVRMWRGKVPKKLKSAYVARYYAEEEKFLLNFEKTEHFEILYDAARDSG